MNDWLMRLYAVYVHQALLASKIDCDFLDCFSKGRTFQDALPLVLQKKCAGRRLYGIAVFMGNKETAVAVMRNIRTSDPGAHIIAFGPFAAVFYRIILEQGMADTVILSDAEFVFPGLCLSPHEEHIPNLAFLRDKNISLSSRKVFSNLDSLPFTGLYFASQGSDVIPILTARGCAHRCYFCDRPLLWGGAMRLRSMANVVAEIDALVRKQDARRFAFADADFVYDKGRVKYLCLKILKLPKKIAWFCSARVDSVDLQILRLMHRAGCKKIYFGIESGDAATLRRMGKGHGRKAILQAVQSAKAVGLEVGLFLIVGTPGETARSLGNTRKLLLALSPFSELTVNPLVILPGTALYDEAVRSGRFKPEDFFHGHELVLFDEKRLYRSLH